MKIKSYLKFISLVLITGLFVLLGSCEEEGNDFTNFGRANVSFSDDTFSIVESAGDSTSLSIPVNLDRPNHSGGSVGIHIEGGVYGEDYITSADSPDFVLDFSNTSVTQNFELTPIDDDRLNDDVELEISLTNPTGSIELGRITLLQIILMDDEERMTADVAFDPLEYEVEENDTLSIDINFSNLSTDGGSFTIVSSEGDAAYGEDFIFDGANEDGELTLNVDEYGDTASFDIIALDNDVFEENKTFDIQIIDPAGGVEIGTESIASVTILEDDPSPFASIGFDDSATTSADESTSEVIIDLNLSQPLSSAESVSISIGGASTAILGEDFTFAGGSTTDPFVIDLDSGADNASITLQLMDNDTEEGDKSIILTISETTGDLEIDPNNSTFTFTIEDNEGDSGGGDSSLYLETFESYDNESTDFVVENLGFERIILPAQTMPDSEVPTVINNSGNFTDADDLEATTDNGLNIFTNTQNNTDLPVDGVVDNVLITPAIPDVDGDLTINVDLSYAFRNQNSGEARFYYSTNYDGSGNWDESQWTLLGSETVPTLDGEGFGNNDYKREEFDITATGNLYFAIRITNQLSTQNYRFRFRFDNIRVSAN